MRATRGVPSVFYSAARGPRKTLVPPRTVLEHAERMLDATGGYLVKLAGSLPFEHRAAPRARLPVLQPHQERQMAYMEPIRQKGLAVAIPSDVPSLLQMDDTRAERYAGSIGWPSKMPGTAYGIPARYCLTGGQLKRRVPKAVLQMSDRVVHDVVSGRITEKDGGRILAELGVTVCDLCYADPERRMEMCLSPGKYGERTVILGQHRRIALLYGNLEGWIRGATWLIAREAARTGIYYHRWHDSGDLQSLAHFFAICRIAAALPHIKFWLPTKEYGIVFTCLSKYPCKIPPNLCVRISAPNIGTPPPPRWRRLARARRSTIATSTVLWGGWTGRREMRGLSDCPAPLQDGQCKDCRKCWDPKVANVNYHLH